MHNYPPFEMKDDEAKTAFIEDRRFANLVISGPDGPEAAHVPMLLKRGANGGFVLESHVAATNPVAKLAVGGTAALAIFNGADSYVTPSLYVSKTIHGKVAPTWNYIAVHARGRLEAFSEPDQLHAHLNDLTDLLEQGVEAPWAVSDAPESFVDAMVKAITGLRLSVESFEGIRKLNQNQRQNDREGVIAGLSQSSNLSSQLIAAEMSKDL
ncbi:MAG: transcriptional regulator [Ponticaulis sp.]|nr:transcriptional regulator [Ponticaulis sp.]